MAQIHRENDLAGVRAAHDLIFSDWRSVAPEYARDATGFPAYWSNTWDFAAGNFRQ